MSELVLYIEGVEERRKLDFEEGLEVEADDSIPQEASFHIF